MAPINAVVRRRIRRILQQTQGRVVNSTLFCFIILVSSLSLLFFSIIPAIFHHHQFFIFSSPSHATTTTTTDHSSHSCIVSYGQYDGKIYDLHPPSSRLKEDTSDYSSTIAGKKKSTTSSSSSSLRSFETVVVASAAITASSSSSSSSSSSTAFETINNTCLVESPWMRISRHSVRLPFDNTVGENTDAAAATTAATNNIINDWLYIDYHDRINVLVEAPPPPPSSKDQEDDEYDDDDDDNIDKEVEEGNTQQKSLSNSNSKTPTKKATVKEKEFIILEQTKYALAGQSSLAIVGGVISIDEEPITAAQREVNEELSIVCTTWTSLGAAKQHKTNSNIMVGGRFCTDVNRGMGWIYPYLATDCTYLNKEEDGVSSRSNNNSYNNNNNNNNRNNKDDDNDDEVGGHDVEKQVVQRMTITNIRNAVIAGRFVEVQWSNTVALAMLHYLVV